MLMPHVQKLLRSTVQAFLSIVNRFLLPPDTNAKRMQLSLGFRQLLLPSFAGAWHQTGLYLLQERFRSISLESRGRVWLDLAEVERKEQSLS